MENDTEISGCHIAGFVGVDKYEYIMYLSRVLYHLGKKVLLIDYSENGALSACIPKNITLENFVLDYRGVYFINQCTGYGMYSEGTFDIDQFTASYDCIIVDFGFASCLTDSIRCDELIFITDQQAHNIRRINSIIHNGAKKFLIIKDIISRRVSVRYIIDELSPEENQYKQIYMAYLDDIDYSNKINCQYDLRFCFRKLSRQTKNIIKGLASEFYPELPKKLIDAAYKKAESGE
jgi:hypothetical protein